MARCDHPDCNGKHSGNPVNEWCPAALERKRARDRKYLASLNPEQLEIRRERSREWLSNLPAMKYAPVMLKNRRRQALKRMAERHARAR